MRPPIEPDEMLDLIRFEARQLAHKLPPGHDRDDLESVGNEAVAETIARADRSDPGRFKATMRLTIRNRMKDYLRSARAAARQTARMPRDRESGADVPLEDSRAADPGDRAAARESLTGKRKLLSVRQVGAELPPPGVVAAKAIELQRAVYDAVSPADMGAVMAAMVTEAKAGRVAAARLLIDLTMPGRGSNPTQQVAVVVHHGDV